MDDVLLGKIYLTLDFNHSVGKLPIEDGKTYRVYHEFNIDKQVWELCLIKCES